MNIFLETICFFLVIVGIKNISAAGSDITSTANTFLPNYTASPQLITPETTGLKISFLSLAVKSILVFILIYLTIWVLRLLMKKRKKSFNEQTDINTLETSFITPRQTLQLIKVANKFFLIGITETNITKLHEFNDEESLKILNNRSSSNSKFKSYLTDILNKETKQQTVNEFEEHLNNE